MIALAVGVVAGLAVVLLVPAKPRLPSPRPDPVMGQGPGWMQRFRVPLAALAGAGVVWFVGGRGGLVVGAAAGVAAWWFIGRVEPPDVRRTREQVRRDLPHLVNLLAATLRGGATPGDGVRMACSALPGLAAARLAVVTERLALGVDPARVWESLAADADLAPLGRTLARAHEAGAPVVAAIERLAGELERSARAGVEERARAVGVKAALPLGLCLLPSFILLGVVPLVAGLMFELTL